MDIVGYGTWVCAFTGQHDVCISGFANICDNDLINTAVC